MRLLEVEGLAVGRPGGPEPPLVSGVSLAVEPGGVLGITGQSGSGKTLTACALCGLLPPPLRVLAGRARFRGQALDLGDARVMRRRRGRDIFLVFQSPAGALDPSARVGEQVAETLWEAGGLDRPRARRTARELMAGVGLEPGCYGSYPFQLSGGQRQRALMAMALGLRPRLLIADEPTTGLDDANREHMVSLLAALAREHGVALCLISHDLRVLAALAQDLVVLERGRVVEQGPADQVLAAPAHPHTRELVAAKTYLEQAR